MNSCMMMKLLTGLLSFVLFLPAAATEVVVPGGGADREGALVSFEAPQEMRGELSLSDGKGTTLPLQVDEDGRAVFVLPRLEKGGSATFSVGPKEPVIFPVDVEVTKHRDQLQIVARDGLKEMPLLGYQMQPGGLPQSVPEVYAHGAHLHPLFSPSGKMVTGNYSPDHYWYRGVWMAWEHAQFRGHDIDFWNLKPDRDGDINREVRFTKLERFWSGRVQGGFVSHHQFLDQSGGGDEVPVLDETWEVRATPVTVHGKLLFLIDLTSTQACAGKDPLKLLPPYGGLGVRGSRAWDMAGAESTLTSEGADRAAGSGHPARWVVMSGDIEGSPASLAVLAHPGNLHAPQTMHLGTESPLITVSPTVESEWSIEPGRPLVSRYRLVVMDGRADAALLDMLWNDFADPLKVQCR